MSFLIWCILCLEDFHMLFEKKHSEILGELFLTLQKSDVFYQGQAPASNYMFKVNNRNTSEHISKWTYLAPCSSVSHVNFEEVNAGWETYLLSKILFNCPFFSKLILFSHICLEEPLTTTKSETWSFKPLTFKCC